MKDNEKQIKLLTKRISKIQNKGVKYIPNCTNLPVDNQKLAEELLKHYQPKLPKHSVVLSKEEYEKYQNLKRDVEHSFEYNQGYIDGQNKGSKETAEKFYNFVRYSGRSQIVYDNGEEKSFSLVNREELNNFVKQLGIEIRSKL